MSKTSDRTSRNAVRRNAVTTLILTALIVVTTTRVEAIEPTSWSPSLMMQVKRVGSVQVSPDGHRAAFTVRQAVMEKDLSEYRTHIHLANIDGSHRLQVTQGDASCDDPQWSPNGQWIAFVSRRVGKKNLWAIKPDGGEAIQITDIDSDVSSFRWSPAGDSIAFTALDSVTEDERRRTRKR